MLLNDLEAFLNCAKPLKNIILDLAFSILINVSQPLSSGVGPLKSGRSGFYISTLMNVSQPLSSGTKPLESGHSSFNIFLHFLMN